MTFTSSKNIEDRLLDISKLEDMNPESIYKFYKMKTMLDYFESKDKNKKLSQKSICENTGISRSTLYRTRVDLGMNSLNRYDIPVTTEAQRKKDKIRRDVTKLYDSKSIDINERDSLRKQISDNNLENVISRIREMKSTITEATSVIKDPKNKSAGHLDDEVTVEQAETKLPASNRLQKMMMDASAAQTTKASKVPRGPSTQEIQQPTADEIIDKYT